MNATDPSGYFVFTLIAAVALATAETAVAWYVAGVVMGVAGFMDALAQGASFKQALQSGLISGISAAAFAGIGTQLGNTFGGDFAAGLSGKGFALKVGLHGLTGGVMAELQGGKFGHGFAAAGFTALGSSFNNSKFIGGKGFNMGRVAIGAVIGGTASKLSGGKFANGAATGAFSQAFNNELSEQRSYKSTFEKMSEKFDRINANIEDFLNRDVIAIGIEGTAIVGVGGKTALGFYWDRSNGDWGAYMSGGYGAGVELGVGLTVDSAYYLNDFSGNGVGFSGVSMGPVGLDWGYSNGRSVMGIDVGLSYGASVSNMRTFTTSVPGTLRDMRNGMDDFVKRIYNGPIDSWAN